MTLSTYDGLRHEIQVYLDREDLWEQTRTFIRLAEARHARELRIREMMRRAQAPVSSRYIGLPVRFEQMRTLYLLENHRTPLKEVSANEMMKLSRESEGTPRYFSVHNEIEFDRKPAEEMTVEMQYWARPEPLSDDNPTNTILQRAPDLYLYGSLLEAEPWLANDERLELWAQLYTQSRDAINETDRRRSGRLVSRVSGDTP